LFLAPKPSLCYKAVSQFGTIRKALSQRTECFLLIKRPYRCTLWCDARDGPETGGSCVRFPQAP
jgi:hypothetical protein